MLFLALMILTTSAYAQDQPAYRLYDGSGKALSFKDLVKKMSEQDVILRRAPQQPHRSLASIGAYQGPR